MLALVLAPLPALAPQGPPLPEHSVHWSVEPVEVVIGEPSRWTLVVEHPSDERPDLAGVELGLDDSWVVVDAPPVRRRATDEGTLRSERVWTVLSLEPGERAAGAVDLHFQGGRVASVPPLTLNVAPELAEGEDAPRPLPGLHDVPERAGPLRPRHLGLVLVVLAVVLAGSVWMRRARRRRPGGREPTDRERLAALDRSVASDPARVRELAYGLSDVLRVAAARGVDGAGPGMDDGELVALLRRAGHRPAAAVDELEDLLATLGAMKYGGERPTRFAIDAAFERAERWLAESQPAPAQEVAA